MAAGIPARLSAGELRRFGLLVGGVFAALGGLLLWRGAEYRGSALLALGGVLLLLGAVLPTALEGIYRLWMRLGIAISRVTTPIILGALYLLVITPIGALRRLGGRNSVLRPRDHASRWVARPAGPADPARMRNPY